MNIVFAKRFYVLLLLGLIPLSFSWLSPFLLWVVALYDLCVLAAAFGDAAALTPSLVRVERETEKHFSQAAENPVQLRLSNRSTGPVRVRIRDEFPIGMAASTAEIEVTILAGQEVTRRYTLTPSARGDYQFGRTIMRMLGRRRLAWRQVSTGAEQTVRVYPNFRQAAQIELFAQRHRQMLVGSKRIRFHGPGREFESLRDFVTGDEMRHISWTATARRGKLVTRQYQAERNQDLMIMLDTGRMMKAEVDRLSKLDHAINAALSLAYVALSGGDNVGLLMFSRGVNCYIPAKRRADQLTALLESLYNAEAELIESNYAAAFQTFTTRNKKRSLVVILTDIINRDASSELLAYTSLLTARHLPLIVTIGDKDLKALVEQVPADITTMYQQAIAEELLGERRDALAFITSRGGLAIDVTVGNVAVELVNQYLEVKEQGLL